MTNTILKRLSSKSINKRSRLAIPSSLRFKDAQVSILSPFRRPNQKLLLDCDRYLEIALESGQADRWKEIDFERKSVFCRNFDDLISSETSESRGFWLFLRENNEIDRYELVVRSKSFFSSSTDQEKARRILEKFDSEIKDEDSIQKLSDLQIECYDRLRNQVFPNYLKSTYHYRYQRQILRENNYELSDLIYCEHTLRHLREFFDAERLENVLSFWLAADDFRYCVKNKLFGDYSEVLLDGLAIYRKYISPQGALYLGFDEAIRMQIEYQLSPKLKKQNEWNSDSSEQGQLIQPNMFDQAMWIAYKIMKSVLESQFKTSLMHTALLKELTILAGQRTYVNREIRSGLTFGQINWLGRFVSKHKETNFEEGGGSRKSAEEDCTIEEKFAEQFIEDIILNTTSMSLTSSLIPSNSKNQ